MKQLIKAALAAAVLVWASASAWAANVSLTGNLAGDNSVQLFSFTLSATSNVTLRTWSYAGGTNAAGNAIAAGGFDTIVSLFSGLGPTALLIDANDDGFGVGVDPSTGLAFDSLLTALGLTAGDYTVALTQFANFANGPTLGDGFFLAGNPNFDGRRSAWALDILGADRVRVIPEPTTLVLAALGLGLVGLRRPRAALG